MIINVFRDRKNQNVTKLISNIILSVVQYHLSLKFRVIFEQYHESSIYPSNILLFVLAAISLESGMIALISMLVV